MREEANAALKWIGERVSPPTDNIPSPRKRADFPQVFRHERTLANRLRETNHASTAPPPERCSPPGTTWATWTTHVYFVPQSKWPLPRSLRASGPVDPRERGGNDGAVSEQSQWCWCLSDRKSTRLNSS